MITSSVQLLNDLDNQLNTYCMRVREWYGWHFPELGKMLTDNLTYVEVVKNCRQRSNFSSTTLSEFIASEKLRHEIVDVAALSMGCDMADDDMENILTLCNQVLLLDADHSSLKLYIEDHMKSVAPNLTGHLGALPAAQLITKYGGLENIGRVPASIIQALGAEKALFRTLRGSILQRKGEKIDFHRHSGRTKLDVILIV